MYKIYGLIATDTPDITLPTAIPVCRRHVGCSSMLSKLIMTYPILVDNLATTEKRLPIHHCRIKPSESAEV